MSDLTQTPSQAHDDLKALVAKHESGEKFTELDYEETRRLSLVLRNEISKNKIDARIVALKQKAQLALTNLETATTTGAAAGKKVHAKAKKTGTPPELKEKPAPEAYEVFSKEEQLSTAEFGEANADAANS